MELKHITILLLTLLALIGCSAIDRRLNSVEDKTHKAEVVYQQDVRKKAIKVIDKVETGYIKVMDNIKQYHKDYCGSDAKWGIENGEPIDSCIYEAGDDGIQAGIAQNWSSYRPKVKKELREADKKIRGLFISLQKKDAQAKQKWDELKTKAKETDHTIEGYFEMIYESIAKGREINGQAKVVVETIMDVAKLYV